MLVCRGFFRGISLAALGFASSAVSQNLLVNPGFDRDLAGWTVATPISPDPSPVPGYVEASASWVASDRAGSPSSGGAAFHARAGTMSYATPSASQCVPLPGGTVVSFGALILTARQYVTAGAETSVTFFGAAACSGNILGTATASSLPSSVLPSELNSAGLWLPASGLAVVPGGAQSIRFSVGARATGTMAYGLSYVDAVADDAFLTSSADAVTTALLPSAAWAHGAAGAYWRTKLTIVNPGASDAAVTLRFLSHDGSAAPLPFTFHVRAGQTLMDAETNFEVNLPESYGSMLVTSSSPSVFVQSETTTFLPGGGSVGQALPALGAADFAASTPKTLAPIRENASFRTNLVLANATEAPLTAHVVLYAADGTLVGSRDVDLLPLGMTQINHVASALGATTLDAGRLSVSTPTPGGLVAAYASVIDNTTNDPRTLLPR